MYRKLLVLGIVNLLLVGSALAQGIRVTVDPKSPQAAISPDFLGLSFEMEKLLPDEQRKHFFRPDNAALIAAFKTLGVKSLRVGGNTADRPTVKIPGPSDIDPLFGFAKAAGVKVIYTLRLKEGDPAAGAQIAKYILDRYRDDLTCIAIGNEPNVFATEYPVYRDAWQKYAATVTAAAPGAKFCGPSATPGKVAWARDFVNDVGPSGLLVMVTQHDYPGNSARKVTDQAAARALMLSYDWVKNYEKFHGNFAAAAASHKLPYRLEEANSFFHGGAKDVSDTLAAALWGLDYMFWWASHDAQGINFHTGDFVAAADENTICRYAVFRTSPGGFTVSPLGHAFKAFDLAGRGRLIPIKIAQESAKFNLTAYGVITDEKIRFVTLINKEHAPARDAEVALEVTGENPRGQVMYLTAPGGDLAATSGITLAGSTIQDDASWKESWIPLEVNAKSGSLNVKVPAASAAIIKLTTD